MSEAKKSLYEDSVIPDAENNYEQWNELFDTASYNLKIDKDYSHISVLQESQEQKAKAREVLNKALLIEFLKDLLKVNRWLELNGEDTIGSDGDVYWSEWKTTRGIQDPKWKRTISRHNRTRIKKRRQLISNCWKIKRK